MQAEVIYESHDFLVLNKPAGLLVHPAKPEETKDGTLVGWLLKKYPELNSVGDEPNWRPGIVHRLDKATSGVMIIPKTQEYFLYLKSLFQKGEIRKTYLAVVFGNLNPKKGVIEKPIGIGQGTLKRSVRGKRMVKEAVTAYEVVESKKINGEDFDLVKVMPKTGRTHQIRVHLAYLNHAVVGDPLYGPKKQPIWARRLMLHAQSLEWSDSKNRNFKIEAPPPPDFAF